MFGLPMFMKIKTSIVCKKSRLEDSERLFLMFAGTAGSRFISYQITTLSDLGMNNLSPSLISKAW